MAHASIDKAVYKGKRWQKCRAAYVAQRVSIDGGLCELCRRELGEIVHHVVALSVDNCHDPAIAYNFDNLQFACWSCHERTKTKGGIPIRADIAFDDQGNVIPTGKIIHEHQAGVCPPS